MAKIPEEMKAMPKKFEYAVKYVESTNVRLGFHQVTKFEEGRPEPVAQYEVYMSAGRIGRCNCFAGGRKGNEDKHVGLVRKWLREKKPDGKLYTL